MSSLRVGTGPPSDRGSQRTTSARDDAAASEARSRAPTQPSTRSGAPTTDPESLLMRERRREGIYGRNFASLFKTEGSSAAEPLSLSKLYRQWTDEKDEGAQKRLLSNELKGGADTALNLWLCFCMPATEAVNLHASSVATGKVWLPHTEALAIMSSVVDNKRFKLMYKNAEEGHLATYFTGAVDINKWNFDATEKAMGRKKAPFAFFFLGQLSILIEDIGEEFTCPLRGSVDSYLEGYPIAGRLFPRRLEEGSATLRREAITLLALIGVEPPNKRQKLLLFTSLGTLQFAKRLIYVAGPERVALGLRRAGQKGVEESNDALCILPFGTLAHAASMIISHLRLLSVCTAVPATQEFDPTLARILSADEKKDLRDVGDLLQEMEIDATEHPEDIGLQQLARDVNGINSSFELFLVPWKGKVYMPVT